MGLLPPFDHKTGIPDGLRTRLWNAVYDQLEHYNDRGMDTEHIERQMWSDAFKKPLRELDAITNPDYRHVRMEHIEHAFRDAKWYIVYDAVQLMGEYTSLPMAGFREACNKVLAEEGAPYRFVNDQLVPTMSDQEAAEVAVALNTSADTKSLASVNEHLRSAGARLSGRPPDFRNSIKESVSAVEALVRLLVGRSATLGDGLKGLEEAGVPIHPALVRGYGAIYGYTNDADGVRHSLETDSVPAEQLEDLAVYMYTSCSAFVSLLIKQARKAGKL